MEQKLQKLTYHQKTAGQWLTSLPAGWYEPKYIPLIVSRQLR